jgi:hypothetical protein
LAGDEREGGGGNDGRYEGIELGKGGNKGGKA